MRLVLAVVFLVGCANVHVNRAALFVSTASLACDWAQTRSAVADGWNEQNPIMGSHPSAGEINLYFATAAAINAAIWLVTPERYRVVPSAIVSASQAKSIALNASYGAGVCGVGGPGGRDMPIAALGHR